MNLSPVWNIVLLSLMASLGTGLGGVKVFITLDELIPTACEYGHEPYTAIGIILGSMFVFVLSGLFGM
jgi:zinc transporter ZupT